MNDLFSANSFRRLAAANANSEEMITIDLGGRPPLPPKKTKRGSATADIQMASAAEAARDTVNLDKFFSDVEGVKEELSAVEATRRSLEQLHDESKLAHSSSSVKDLRSRMDAEVSDVLKRAKVIKLKLEALDRANAANRSLPGCGPGSSTDRTRSSVVSGLRRKLKDSMEEFQGLRQRIMGEYKETIGRRYFTVTGQQAEESTLEKLISTGESEQLLQRAIRDQAGRGNITDTVSEIQERHDGVKEMEKSLLELHQIFLDMSVLVESQGAMLDDIEANVGRASSFVRDGAGNLEMAKVHQKSTRKWTCIAIVLVLVIVLIIVIPIVVSLRKTTTTS